MVNHSEGVRRNTFCIFIWKMSWFLKIIYDYIFFNYYVKKSWLSKKVGGPRPPWPPRRRDPCVFICCSTALTCYHSLPLVVTHFYSLSLVVPLVVTRCRSLSLVVSLVLIRCHSFYHSLSFVLTFCTTRYHPLSLDVPVVCLFISDRFDFIHYTEFIFLSKTVSKNLFE